MNKMRDCEIKEIIIHIDSAAKHYRKRVEKFIADTKTYLEYINKHLSEIKEKTDDILYTISIEKKKGSPNQDLINSLNDKLWVLQYNKDDCIEVQKDIVKLLDYLHIKN